MNIQEAREEIIRTVRAYTAKDETGGYRIPAVRQRPILLMGPPGIGKTAVVTQAAKACGVGLAAYTITHHTRQSAVGLPQLVSRQFEGREYTVTEYTMSEIVSSIYEYMERSGYREGILFIDEINCVSETLAPTMLQFLQYKTFGNHRIPKGWVVVSAGNPPEFNRSARELDMAVQDRVRTIHVEADYSVWRDYAFERGVHPVILSYLEMKPECFYQVVQTREKSEFVTARGWEDLSALLLEYERQEVSTDGTFVEEFIRNPKIAADFFSYYQLYLRYMGLYRIPELLTGKLSGAETEELLTRLREAGADVRCIFVRHLLAAASQHMTHLGELSGYVKRRKEVREQFSRWMEGGGKAEEFLRQRAHALEIKSEYGLLGEGEEVIERRIDRELADGPFPVNICMDEDDGGFEEEKRRVNAFLNRAADCIQEAFGNNLELSDLLLGIKNHRDFAICGFERPELTELCGQREKEQRLRREIKEMEGLYETADSV